MMALGGTSTAAQKTPTYMNFYMLLDNTPSMGLGATPTDQTNLINATAGRKNDSSCAFACHTTNDPDSANQPDYYTVAKQIGVTMRIDVVRQATQQLMTTAEAMQQVSNQFQMAIGTFGSRVSGHTAAVVALRSDDAAKCAIHRRWRRPDDDPISKFQQRPMHRFQCRADAGQRLHIPSSGAGAGTSSANPQNILFMVSDGVNDSYNASGCLQTTTSGRCQEPINTSYCQALKNRGVQIAVLYTTYLPLPSNGWYMSWINPFSNSISTNMQKCASPGFYFEVNSTQSISAAMNALFTTVVRQARLTH